MGTFYLGSAFHRPCPWLGRAVTGPIVRLLHEGPTTQTDASLFRPMNNALRSRFRTKIVEAYRIHLSGTNKAIGAYSLSNQRIRRTYIYLVRRVSTVIR